MPDRDEALAALDAVIDPRSGRGLAAAGLVQGLVVGPDRAGFMLEVPAGEVALYGRVREAAEAALRALPGVARAHVALTAEDASRPRLAPHGCAEEHGSRRSRRRRRIRRRPPARRSRRT